MQRGVELATPFLIFFDVKTVQLHGNTLCTDTGVKCEHKVWGITVEFWTVWPLIEKRRVN